MRRRVFEAWICLLVFIGMTSSVQAYECNSEQLGESGGRICSDPGVHTQSFTCQSTPHAKSISGGEVELLFFARADLDNFDEFINVDINGVDFDATFGGPAFGRLFVTGGNTGCGGVINGGVSGINPIVQYFMDAADWNAFVDGGNGNVVFDFDTPFQVECLICAGCKCGELPDDERFSWVQVVVSYVEVECDDDVDCSDGAFCNGAETCDGNNECQPGTAPCSGQLCCEIMDVCHDNCCDDSDCPSGDRCDVMNDVCVDCLIDDDCEVGFFCNDNVCSFGADCESDAECTPGSPAPCIDYACGGGLVNATVSTSSAGYSETGTGWDLSGGVGECFNEIGENEKFRAIDFVNAPATATWTTSLPESGLYDVSVCFQASVARGEVGYDVVASDGTYRVDIDQATGGDSFYNTVSLGTFSFTTANPATVTIDLANVTPRPSGQTLVIADSVHFVKSGVCTQTPTLNGGSCSDDVFCNGEETCQNGACTPNENPCNLRETCDELESLCLPDDCSAETNPDAFCVLPNPSECSSCRVGASTIVTTQDGASAYVESGPGWGNSLTPLGCDAANGNGTFRAFGWSPGLSGTATWTTPIGVDEGGIYDISVCFRENAKRAENVEYIVSSVNGPVSVIRSQYRVVPDGAEQVTKSLGYFELAGGTDASVALRLDDIVEGPGTSTNILADTVIFERLPACVYSACSVDCNSNFAEDAEDILSGASFDCNTNGIPDECELSGNDCDTNGVPDECQSDCNTNGVTDMCELPDWDMDGDVDLIDFQHLQQCMDSSTSACLAVFDLRTPCGVVDLLDFGGFADDLAGPTDSGGQSQAMMGGGGGTSQVLAPVGGGTSSMSATATTVTEEEENAPATVITATGAIEFRNVGSNGAMSALEKGKTYEVHYSTNAEAVDSFVIFGVSDNAGKTVLTASKASSGPWSSDTNFIFDAATVNTPAAPAHGFPNGWYRTDTILNDLIGLDGTVNAAGPDGYLCDLTPQSTGELKLEVNLFYIDVESNTATEVATTVSIVVHEED